MKTGEFAKKYNLSSNGIRYYVEQGLLSPEVSGSQYNFTKECIETMEQIHHLKDMGFHLPEISRIFHIKRLSQYSKDKDATYNYRQIFEQKKEELQDTINQFNKSIALIDQELTGIKLEDAENTEAGVHIDSLQLLACPHCKSTLNFENSKIVKNSILSAKLSCECGYEAEIKNGILIGQQKSKKKVEWSNLANITVEHSVDYINLETKAYFEMKEYIKKSFPEGNLKGVVFTSGGYAGDFICCYSHIFDENITLIVADQNLDTVTHIKNKMSALNMQFKILYICDENFALPLKDKCIDVFLDDFSSSEYLFYDSCYPFEAIKSLLVQNAFIGGVYTYYKMDSKSFMQIQKDYPNTNVNLFTVEALKCRLVENDVEILDKKNLGYVEHPGTGYAFSYHHPDDNLYFFIYFGEKTK